MDKMPGKRKINQIIKQLPRGYTVNLAIACYNSDDKKVQRKIKYWRTGRMKCKHESLKIMNSAMELLNRF